MLSSLKPPTEEERARRAVEGAKRDERLKQRGEELLRALPQCTAKILIAGPSYGDKPYTGDVIADTVALLLWAEEHAARQSYRDDDSEAARRVLPDWLKNADLTMQSPTLVIPPFHDLLSNYAHVMVARKIAQVFCPDCRGLVEVPMAADMGGIGITKATIRASLIWHCPAGHVLRRWEGDDQSRVVMPS